MADAKDMNAYNTLAVYGSMDEARTAMAVLDEAGIDAVDVSLIGPGPEEAADQTDTAERDHGATSHVARRAAAGGAIGTVGGGLAGLLGAMAFTIPGIGPVVGAGIWAAAVSGAVAGGAVGGVIGGVSSIRLNEAWELTFASIKRGEVVLGVHSEDRDQLDRAVRLLDDTDPRRVASFDREGRPMAHH